MWHLKNCWCGQRETLRWGVKHYYKSNPLKCVEDVCFFSFFFYWISTLSHDSWAPVSVYPHSEHSEERCWPQLYVPLPKWASRSIKAALLDEMYREKTVEHDKLLLYHLLSFIAIMLSFLSLYCILTRLQVFVWDQSVQLPLFLFLCLLSVCSKSTIRAEWRTDFYMSECVSPLSLVSHLTPYYKYNCSSL